MRHSFHEKGTLTETELRKDCTSEKGKDQILDKPMITAVVYKSLFGPFLSRETWMTIFRGSGVIEILKGGSTHVIN